MENQMETGIIGLLLGWSRGLRVWGLGLGVWRVEFRALGLGLGV